MAASDRVSSYAQAFYEAAVERWLNALQKVVEQLEADPSLLDRIAQHRPLLDQLLPPDVDLPVRNFLYTLVQRGDLALLPHITESLEQRMRRPAVALTVAEVTSAVPLTDDERQTLVTRLEEQFGRGLEMRYRVDPTILGGLVVRVGDKLIDGSVAGKLAALKQTLGVTDSQR